MHIGEVAKRAGVTSDAIRFYERCGILAKPPRTDAGYRLWSPDNVAVVLFLRRAQTLGFSLPQIRELVSLRTSGRPCAPVRDRLRRKLEEVRTKAHRARSPAGAEEMRAAPSRAPGALSAP